jgi:hypothetical protein
MRHQDISLRVEKANAVDRVREADLSQEFLILVPNTNDTDLIRSYGEAQLLVVIKCRQLSFMLLLLLRLNQIELLSVKLEGFLIARLKAHPDTVLVHGRHFIINIAVHDLKKLEISAKFKALQISDISLFSANLPDAQILFATETDE